MSKNKHSTQTNLVDYIDANTGECLSAAISQKSSAQPEATQDFLTSVRFDPGLSDWGPSLTRQEFKDECDINFIMASYEAHGTLNHVNRADPLYVDLTTMPSDYQTALGLLTQAETAFMTLPATVRREFENDPQQFVAFASDPENLPQMQTWGLAPPPAQAAPAASAAAPEAAPPPPSKEGVV